MAQATFTAPQKKFLITLLVILAVLRFVGAPFIDYQAEQRANLALTSLQYERALRLLEQDIDSEQLAALQAQLNAYESAYLVHTGTSEFRLQAQRRIQQVANEHGGQVNLFDWLSEREIMPNYLHSHQARIVLEGKTEHLVQAQLAIQEQVRGVSVVEFALQELRPDARRSATGRLTLLITAAGLAAGEQRQ